MSAPTEAAAAVRPPFPEIFEDMSLPLRTAAGLLGLTPWTVERLIDRGILTTVQGGQYRYVTLTSILTYRRLGR
ncbi:hypothetical protein [Streptomyces hiroshimensis]|uniref:Helix-turn-helix domain-containing protein n=1 Tax=Streptomyces hiroshimensis TaxID=66424 RepID=A0ABQ2ZA63_9ACTN|nr:hypothetical protein [Streptomyces hiroshimensis]GGY09785.1 hypothetical protein GCM10010324_65760 [Streptomyces hiroshimensis]